ncbi:MAG: toprim domain-containing protein [Gemmatimonadaceae bacterium]|nr:toprim domain-containing protein [Gemmatimonadaceae bacterium]
MSARVDAAELRRHPALADPLRLCAALGLTEGGRRQPTGWLVRCPVHADRTPSCSVTRGPDATLRWRCFACATTGDALDLVAAVRGLDTRRDFAAVCREAAELAGVELDEDGPRRHHTPAQRPAAPRPAPEPKPEPKPTDEALDGLAGVLGTIHRIDDSPLAADVTRYLEGRHLLAEAKADGWFALPPAPRQGELVRWLAELGDHGAEDVAPEHAPSWKRADLEALGWLPRIPHGAARLCIPWRSPDGLVTTIQRRRLDDGRPKYVFPDGRGARWPYGVERLRDGAPIAIVEGAIDAVALRALCRMYSVNRDVIGLPGVTGWRDDWAELLSGREVFLALDADKAGEDAVARLAEVAAGAVKVLRWTPTGGGDWCDELARHVAATKA